MSGDSPKWLDELEQELGLGETPAPDEEVSLLEVIKNTSFTPQGWARVYKLIMEAGEDIDPALLRRVMDRSDDDLTLFMAMIALPYYLTEALGYDKGLCEKLIAFVAASYVIAIARGYEFGSKDSRDARQTRDE